MVALSNQEILDAARQDHPELKGAADGDLLAAIAKDHPELFPAGTPEYKQKTAEMVQGHPGSAGSVTNTQNLADAAIGVNPASLWERVKGAASTVNSMLPAGSTPRPGTVQQLTPQEEIGSKVMAVAPLGELATAGASAVGNALPSTERAGQKFSQVAKAAGDIPIDTSKADSVLERVKELRQRGSTMPKVTRDYEKARKPGDFMGMSVDAPPMTYNEGRDFATNAGRLSVRESQAANPQMQSQVSQFAQALKAANRKAAESVGMENLYDQAIKEYHQAKSMQEAGDIIKKWSVRALLGGAVTGAAAAGYKAYQALP